MFNKTYNKYLPYTPYANMCASGPVEILYITCDFDDEVQMTVFDNTGSTMVLSMENIRFGYKIGREVPCSDRYAKKILTKWGFTYEDFKLAGMIKK